MTAHVGANQYAALYCTAIKVFRSN